MPVTLRTADHPVEAFKPPLPVYPNAAEFLRFNVCFSKNASKVLSSSNPHKDPVVLYSPNGFVRSVIQAYSCHHHLTIRPDDVWISIVSQLSLYVNAHADDMRTTFVAHEGKKLLRLRIPQTALDAIDWDSAGDRMLDLMETQLLDPELKDWILPAFTTTTRVDKTVCSMLMMASLKQYFSYHFDMRCGIPQITLDGTQEDWSIILGRLEKLSTWSKELKSWAALLRPILARFVAAFTTDKVDTEFWGHIASPHFFGSGTHTLGGWITAFCAFNEKGRFLGNDQITNSWQSRKDEKYILDSVTYPSIDSKDIPPGGVDVDIIITDAEGNDYDVMFIAGNLGIRLSDGKKGVQSESVWACCLVKTEEDKKRSEEAEAKAQNRMFMRRN
jgi:Domain of unknown function (DUF4419)